MEMVPTSRIEESSPAPVSYVAELQDFFRTRDVAFGRPEHLAPFIERLQTDGPFRDEMSSMIRAIMYQARDGFGEGELQALIVRAVGGQEAEKVRVPLQKLLEFVHGVFRSRWRTIPEETTAESTEAPVVEADSEGGQIAPKVEGPSPKDTNSSVARSDHSGGSIFSKANVLSSARAQEKQGSSAEPGLEMEPTPEREWSGSPLEDSYESESGSRKWLWNAGFAGLIVAFSGGLFFAQRAAVDMFQQQHARSAVANTARQSGSAHIEKVSVGNGPASPNPAPANAGIIAKPVAPSPKMPEGSSNIDQMTRSHGASMAVPGRYTPVTLGVSPALMRNRLIYAPKTDYPTIARLTHVQGKVVVEAIVSRNGRVTHADVISGHRLLRGAALRAVRRRKYRPYTVDGKPRAVATILTVDFKLR